VGAVLIHSLTVVILLEVVDRRHEIGSMPTIRLRIDSALVKEAREAACRFGRSPAAQIEFWAMLGAIAESVLSARSVKRIVRVQNLGRVIAAADPPDGRARYAAVVRSG
jgi:hypothetical protein